MPNHPALPCAHAGAPPDTVVQRVVEVIHTLSSDTKYLERHGISRQEYIEAFPAAIERIRGSTAASNSDRRNFLIAILHALKDQKLVAAIETPKYGEDTVYRLELPGGNRSIAIIQKGCPDGAHSSTRWTVPVWASETYIWWCCSSLAREPGSHVSAGVNRLRQKFFSDNPSDVEQEMIDGVVFYSELCGTPQRLCPKAQKAKFINGFNMPPPCLLTFPKRAKNVTSWNWDSNRNLIFPKLLFSLFDIPEEGLSDYLGHIGFQARGKQIRTSISIQFGPGRSTIYRS